MNDDNIVPAAEPKRSNEYIELIKQLKDSITSAFDIAQRLFEQGKKDGLPNDLIRKDIELALAGVVKERQLRNILPLELKRTYTISSDDINSAMIAELGTEEIHILPRYEQINNSGTNKYESDLFNGLKDYIAVNGQRSPIIINQDGIILDGHKTYAACKQLGIKPKFEVKPFDNRLNEMEFIIDSNLDPRMREWQRCQLAIQLEKVYKAREAAMKEMPSFEEISKNWSGNIISMHNYVLANVNEDHSILCWLCRIDEAQTPGISTLYKEVNEYEFNEHIFRDHELFVNGWKKYVGKLLTIDA